MFVEGPRTSWSGGGPTEVKALAVGQAGGGEHGSGSGFDAGPCRLFTQFARGGWERVQDLMQDLQVGTLLLCSVGRRRRLPRKEPIRNNRVGRPGTRRRDWSAVFRHGLVFRVNVVRERCRRLAVRVPMRLQLGELHAASRCWKSGKLQGLQVHQHDK